GHVSSARSVCSVSVDRMRQPPRAPPFPYTTLFRSRLRGRRVRALRGNPRKAGFCTARVLGPGPAGIAVRGQYPYGLHRRPVVLRSEEHTSELQSRENLVCRLLLEKKNTHAVVHTAA